MLIGNVNFFSSLSLVFRAPKGAVVGLDVGLVPDVVAVVVAVVVPVFVVVVVVVVVFMLHLRYIVLK